VAHEIALRGGTVVDGTGGPALRADVGIAGGRIAEIGPRVRGAREIDASGRLVVPGFIDLHTHYDPQVLWDPQLTPSSWHGVTAVVAGNCGYSLAPTRPEDRPSLLRTLDKVEDMRIATLEAGVKWDFETYPEYLDAVRRRGIAIHFGGYVGHTAVRLYAMGDDAYERPATDAEIARMKRVVADSLRGGALGFSSDRAGFHLADGGRPVPSIAATQAETEALCAVTAEIGRGVVCVAAGEDYRWVYDLQLRLGRKLNWSAILTYPREVKRGSWQEKLAAHLAGRRAGADVCVQVSCRPIEQELLMVEPTAFYVMPAFKELVALPHAERGRLYADRGWRARVQANLDENGLLNSRWDSIRVLESPGHPELVGCAIGALAAERGSSPFDAICDLAIADDLRTRLSVTFANDEVEGVTKLLQGEGCILGLSDAGAHVSQICDAIMPTDFLAHWVRDREVVPLERGIRKLTGEIAEVLELDRGTLRVGAPADVVVLDYERLSPGPIRRVRDMPAQGERLVADAPLGIDHVLVNGVPIRTDGVPVQADLEQLPGTILTNEPAAATARG
jgi:N-acyl-D-amino-acid deacylase